MILLDTNILLRMAQVNSPQHFLATEAVLKLNQADVEMCLVPQAIYEFWVVATRPVEVNGLGMNAEQVDHSIRELIQTYQLLRDERGIFTRWQSLVTTHEVLGKNAHDARLVAAMQRHQLTHLLTFNNADFKRFSSIEVLTPADIAAGNLPA